MLFYVLPQNTTQRLKRVELIKKLKSEFAQITVDPDESEEQRIWDELYAQELAEKAAQKKAQEDEAAELKRLLDEENKIEQLEDKEAFIFPFHIRKKHFKRKLTRLENEIKETEAERQGIDAERIRLTLFLKEQQAHLMDLIVEKQRVKDFQAPVISSSVLHGTVMNYYLADFRKALIKAFDKCQAEMTEAKSKIISGEKKKVLVLARLEQLKDILKDRRAAFNLFTLDHENAMKALNGLKGMAGGAEGQLVKFFFQRLKGFVKDQKKARAHVGNLMNNICLKYLRAAFTKWLTGEHAKSSQDKDAFISAGSLMLQEAKELREDVQRQLREAIAETFDIKQKLEVAMIPKYQRKAITTSNYLPIMAEGTAPSSLEMHGMHYLFEADGMTLANKFEQAVELYEIQIMTLRSMPKVNVKYLAICYGRLGKLFLRSERFDRAIVEFDRQLSLSKEIDDVSESADAYYGMGTGYMGRAEFHEAIRYLDIAHAQFGILGHQPKMCGVKIALRECYTRLNRPDLVNPLVEQIDALENELRNKLQTISSKLTSMGNRLIQSNAEIEFVVQLERATVKIIYLRNEVKEQEDAHDRKEAEVAAQHELVEEMGAFLGAIQAELQAAIETDDREMLTNIVHAQPQVMEVEELKVRLNEIKLKKIEEFGELEKEENRLKTEQKNIFDTITALNEEFEVETGALMKHCKHDRPFRCIAFNPLNAAGDEVTGLASGGVENFAASDGKTIHLLDYHNGGLLHIFQGDERGRLGEKNGHTGVVTCLCYDMNFIYSGSVDELIMVWDAIALKRVNVFSGHEGTVVTMAVDGPTLCSGGADATIRLWNKMTGDILLILQGHTESVLSLEIGPSWLLTGSQDEEIRVWKLHWKTKDTLLGETTHRLVGHECAVTCVRFGTMEVVSGDRKGKIFIWLLKTGEILRKCYVHSGQVKCIQFDATRIVSGGGDGNVCITDIGTGSVVQTLRGHVGLILGLAFDTQRIISVGRDNCLRYWQWGKKSDAPPDKFHVLDKGQKLVDVSKLYKVDVQTLMKWNGILEMRMCVPGMRLIVSKGDPTKLTTAEQLALERDRRKETGLAYTKKAVHDNIKSKGAVVGIGYNRLHRMAMDIDQHSLGNRLSSNLKHKMELFPDMVEVGRDPNSLGARLERNGGEKLSLNARSRGQANEIFITPDNEEEWGPVADRLAITMLEMLVEFETFEVIKEEQRNSRDPQSVLGRIYNPNTLETKKKLTQQFENKQKRRGKPKGPGNEEHRPISSQLRDV
jgi:WD40 repeat protein